MTNPQEKSIRSEFRSDFEKAFIAEFGPRPKVISHDIDAIWDGSKEGSLWSAKWVAEMCANIVEREASMRVADMIRQFAKELE